MKIIKEERGITLIALVITIIVLLILTGVSITAIVGENGIVTKAKTAKEETQKAVEQEEKVIEEIMDYINDEVGRNKNDYIHPEQKVSTYVAIGTDGKAVNMDLWNPTLLEDGTWELGALGEYRKL